MDPPPAPGTGGGGTNIHERQAYSYTNGLWLEILGVTNTSAYLKAHGTVSNQYYQLLSTTNVATNTTITNITWSLEQVFYGAANTNVTVLAPVPTLGRTNLFFEAVNGTEVSVDTPTDAVEPRSPISGTNGSFWIGRSPASSSSLTVYYTLSGSASNGSDYTFLTGSATIPANANDVQVIIEPLEDAYFELGEQVIVTLIRSNSPYYLVGITNSVTVTIYDNTTNFFQTVAENLSFPIGIDYHPPTQSLLVSVSQGNNFRRINSNGVVSVWSGIAGLSEEVKLATVKTSGNFLGAMYFGTGQAGEIGYLSPDGSISNTSWAVLPNEDDLLRGGLYVDQSGAFGGDLIAVTGGGLTAGGGVWRVNSSTNATLVVRVGEIHLEGVVTIPTSATNLGPWAGKIITGAETETPPLIYAINTDGTFEPFNLNIAPEDFDIIPENQDLYCTDPVNGKILKISRTVFTGYIGDLLITQAQESEYGAKLFIVHWDGTRFLVRTILYSGYFEHVTFAPINIPSL